MFSLVHLLLLRLPPELAHCVGIGLLRLYQRIWIGFLKRPRVSTFAIQVHKSWDLKFPSRLGLAAGFDKNAEAVGALSLLGFGFLELGTVTPLPQPGNEGPRLWRVAPYALVNSLGFPSNGLTGFKKNLGKYRSQVSIPLFANIGKNKLTPAESALDDYAKCFSALEKSVDGFVVNVSSPNTPGLRDLQSAEFLEGLEKIAPKGVPVLVKLSPDLGNQQLQALCSQIEKSSVFAGAVLTNTSRDLARDLRGFESGGLSGPPLFSRSLECVSLARQEMKTKILIGVGGVSSPDDAREMRKAGADLVEVYTAFIYQGPRGISKFIEAM